MRIDHLYVTRSVAARCTAAEIDRDARKGQLPSDHAPVYIDLARLTPSRLAGPWTAAYFDETVRSEGVQTLHPAPSSGATRSFSSVVEPPTNVTRTVTAKTRE